MKRSRKHRPGSTAPDQKRRGASKTSGNSVADGRTASSLSGRHAKGSGRASWFRVHARDLRFLLIFGMLMAAFYSLEFLPAGRGAVRHAYLDLTARVTGFIIRGLGFDATVSGSSIRSSRFSIVIARGCDALEPVALFASAVLASPFPFSARIIGVLIGMVVLILINLVRVVSLIFVGIYFPTWLDMMHEQVWQALFILLAIVSWATWVSWISRSRRERTHAPK